MEKITKMLDKVMFPHQQEGALPDRVQAGLVVLNQAIFEATGSGSITGEVEIGVKYKPFLRHYPGDHHQEIEPEDVNLVDVFIQVTGSPEDIEAIEKLLQEHGWTLSDDGFAHVKHHPKRPSIDVTPS